MRKTLRNLVGGVLIGVSTLFNPIKSHTEEIIDNYFEKAYHIEMTSEYGDNIQEELGIEIGLDEEENILYFSYLTENFDKEDWSKEEQRIPLPARYTNINHNFTKVFILHPKEVKISDLEQVAYLVPQHEEEELKPLKESPKAQAMLKAGELLLDWTLTKTKIPFANQLFDEFIKYSTEKSEKHYDEIFKEINGNYTATQIPSFPVDKFFGFMETARGYKISFDMSEAPKGEVPMCLWAKIALGNPSESAHGSFPNRYGELEGIIINFSLEGEKELVEEKKKIENNSYDDLKEPQKLEDYFLQGKELKGIKLAPIEIMQEETGIENNPYIASVRKIAECRKEGLENLTGMGTALYMPLKKRDLDEPGLSMYIVQFENEINAWECLLESAERGILSFLKENTLSFIKINDDIDIIEEKIYLDSLINYQKRTGGIVYPWGVKDTEDYYKKLEIPSSESGRYFRESLEFQKKFYDMNNEELTNFFGGWLNPIKEKYKKGLINKEETITELIKLSKENYRKIFFSLPNIDNTIMKLGSSYPINKEFQMMYLAINVNKDRIEKHFDEWVNPPNAK